MKQTIKVKLLAERDGIYKTFVFQNLDKEDTDTFKYITVTMCPNWQYPHKIKLGDVGYLEYEYAEAGEYYYEPATGCEKQYKYSAFYFMNFIKEEIRDDTNTYKF